MASCTISAHGTEVEGSLEEPIGRPLRQPAQFQRVRSEDVVNLVRARSETHDLIILTLHHRWTSEQLPDTPGSIVVQI